MGPGIQKLGEARLKSFCFILINNKNSPQKLKWIFNPLIRCNFRKAQTKASCPHYDLYCYYSVFIWQSSNWRRSSLSAVTVKHTRTDVALAKYLQTNHCQIFVQLTSTLCWIKKRAWADSSAQPQSAAGRFQSVL